MKCWKILEEDILVKVNEFNREEAIDFIKTKVMSLATLENPSTESKGNMAW